jgi:hypothetical protein
VASVESRQLKSVSAHAIAAWVLAAVLFPSVGFCATGHIISATASDCYRGSTITLVVVVQNTSTFDWGCSWCPAYAIKVRATWGRKTEWVLYQETQLHSGDTTSVSFMIWPGPPDNGLHQLEVFLCPQASPGSCLYDPVDQTLVSFTVLEWPDLQLEGGAVFPHLVYPGDILATVFRLKNIGPGPAVRYSWVEVRLSQDRLFSQDPAVDPWVASRVIPPLPAGAFLDFCTTGMPDAPPGLMNVLVQCDVIDEVPESPFTNGEGNNLLIGQSQILIIRPELVVGTGTFQPPTTPRGSRVDVSFGISNTGNTSSPVCRADVYLVLDPNNPFLPSPWIANIAVDPIGPGGSAYTVGTYGIVPTDTTTGTYHVMVFLSGINDFNKDNNKGDLGRLQVTGGPYAPAANLVINRGSVQSLATAQNGRVHVSVTVANAGNKPAGASKMNLYLSANGVWRPTDPVWISNIAVPSLTPGGTYDYAADLAVPAWANGAYRVIARCNATNTVVEPDGDNTRDIGALSSLTGADHWSLYK